MAKLLVASVAGALAMSLLAYGGSGRLGNFGDVGVDQGALLIGVFFWFAVVGGVTVVMAGGIRRRPRRPKPKPAPAAAAEEPADFAGLFEEPDDQSPRSVADDSADHDVPVSDDDDASPSDEPEPSATERDRGLPVCPPRSGRTGVRYASLCSRHRLCVTEPTRRRMRSGCTTCDRLAPAAIVAALGSRCGRTAPRAPECTGAGGGAGIGHRFAAALTDRRRRRRLPGAGGRGRRRSRLPGHRDRRSGVSAHLHRPARRPPGPRRLGCRHHRRHRRALARSDRIGRLYENPWATVSFAVLRTYRQYSSGAAAGVSRVRTEWPTRWPTA